MANARDVHINLEGHDKTDRATRDAANNLDRLARKMDNLNKKSFARRGVDSGGAFVSGFLSSMTMGRLGGGMNAKLAPVAAKVGARAGILGGLALAGGLLAQLGTVLQAGLPLILGPALLAGPLIYLAKTDKAAQKSMERLKKRAKNFMDFISKPLKKPFGGMLEAVGDGLAKLKKPVQGIFKELGPALVPFTKGVMGGLVAFVKAFAPAMPGIAAGMKEWGRQMPKIGAALGGMLAKLLKDPDRIVQSVQDVAAAITTLIEWIGKLGDWLNTLSGWYRKAAAWIDKWENKMADGGDTAKAFARAIRWVKDRVVAAWISLRENMSQVGADIKRVWNRLTDKASDLVRKVVAFFRGLPGKAGRALSGLWAAIKKPFVDAYNGVVRWVRKIQGIINGLHGKSIVIGVKKIFTEVFRGHEEQTTGGGGDSWMAAGTSSWSPSLGGMFRSAPAAPVVNVAAPNVSTRVFMDSREIAAHVRSTVLDENKRAAYRARVGVR